MIDVKRLRELAQAALWTGNWYNDGCNILMCTYPENSGDLSGESDEIRLVEYMEAAQPKAILALCDRLEAAEKDAERYRTLRRGQHWSVLNGIGDTLRADELDAAIDAALAQRQGEGS
ncbi:hypothetical protein NUJ28_07560 [Burkholderia multivorans]|uniref:hypothetical protein n=1 Tax=Burkholderia multivorans TaxID=87883 RepID=UPI0021DB461A|nr:hypothetical protein [Burkholderia multivorans]UXZ62561.1 hypothetical protein NUJ28_07560 [Burkholderia multivorans]